MNLQDGYSPDYSAEFKEQIILNATSLEISSIVNISVQEVEIVTPARKANYDTEHILTIIIIVLSLITAGFGLFYNSGGAPYNFINQYGDVVKLYGRGLYRHDSFFKAPVFRGTDCTIFFIVCPLLITALIQDIRLKTLKSRMSLIAFISCFMYYAASIAFGVTYNSLLFVYILLFAACFFGLIKGLMSIDFKQVEKSMTNSLSYKGIYSFLIITGIALYAAWLPDIVTALVAKRPLLLIENYTTEITYVIDMGIIAPACFICFYLLKQRKGLGFILLEILLTLCIVIGIMLPVQTMFQIYEGIIIPLPAIITKLGSFCILALFAFNFKVQALYNMADGFKHYT